MINPQSCTTPLRHGVTKYLFALIALCLATSLHAQITFVPTFTNLWVLTAGDYVDLPANGNDSVRGVAINPVTTNVLYASRAASSNHVGVVSFSSGSNYLGSLNALTASAGSLAEAAIRVSDDGSVYVCNVAASTASRFLVFKYNGETTGVNPTIVFDSSTAGLSYGSSYPWRVGDYMDVRGSGASTEIVAVGNGTGGNISTNFVVLRPTDSTCTTFTNFYITIPGGVNTLCGGGVAFEGTNNAIWIRDASTQNTRHIAYNPATLTATCDRTNTVDQSACRGLKYYTNNGVALLATVQESTTLNAAQIARVFQIPSSPTAPLVSVLSANLTVTTGSQNANGLGNVDIQKGYFVFGAPGHGLSFYNIGFVTNSPPSVTSSANGSTFVAGYGLNYVVTAAVSGSPPLSYQWYQTDNSTYTNAISFAKTNVLTITNVTTANAASYFVIVTNLYGKTNGQVSTLAVLPNGGSTIVSNLWSLAPGSRLYLTTGDSQRGIGFAATNSLGGASNVVVVVTHSPTNGAILIDGNTGNDLGNLDISPLSAISPPGTYAMNMCGVADDGVVYVCNLCVNSGSDTTFAIYSWPAADPTAAMGQAYNGTPLSGAGALGRLGDAMAVRGAGVNTEILCPCRNGTNVVLFTTPDGVTFNANILYVTNLVASIGSTDPFTGGSPLALGVAFGPGNTFWAKTSGYNLRLVSFDLSSGNAAVIGSYPIASPEGPLGVDNVNGYLGTIGVNEIPVNTAFYDLDTPGGPTLSSLVDRETYAVNNSNGNGTGQVVFDVKGGRVFSLSSNSGIEAMTYAPRLFYTQAAGGISISWTGPGTLQSASALTGPWSSASTSSPYVSTGAAQLFFRVIR